MSAEEQKSRAIAFRAMHRGPKILLLPNVWDVASARIFEEAGYGDRPEDAARTAREVVEAGAVGMNLEDATKDSARPLVELSLQVEKIHAVREAALKTGVLVVLNARTDVYLLEVGPSEKRYDETVRRLLAFRDAGVDCVFVPGLRDAEIIGRLVQEVKCAVNILGD